MKAVTEKEMVPHPTHSPGLLATQRQETKGYIIQHENEEGTKRTLCV